LELSVNAPHKLVATSRPANGRCYSSQAIRAAAATLLLLNGSVMALPGALVPVNVRLEGLALGNSVSLRQAGVTLSANVNGELALGQAEAGSALIIDVVTQPDGQICALSAQAPAQVPASSAPVFVRCVHAAAPRITAPATAPDDPLRWWQDGAGLRSIAYPGLAYESRPGVVGGQFPYEFRLLAMRLNGQPISTAATSLDFRRGTLRFVPATAGSFEFDIEVRDSAAVQRVAQRTFSVTAAADRFLFVAPNGVDLPGRGSISQPFMSISYALSQGAPSQALMLRAGTYSGHFELLDDRARQLIAYPDEVPIIALNQSGSIGVRIDRPPAARIEGVDITGVRQYGIVSDPSRPGLVIRALRFLDGVVAQGNENPAYLHGWGDSSPQSRHRFLVQDSEFNNYPAGYATTWFDAGDSLFENNQVRLGASTVGVHDKDNSQRNVYRENFIEYSPESSNNVGIQISAQYGSEHLHIHHNLLINSGVQLGGQCVSAECTMREHHVHHNTLVGRGLVLRWGVFNPGSEGTRASHNLIRSTTSPYAWASCLSSVPSGFSTQFGAAANRLETASTNAMRDTECSGSPMNIAWASWRDTHGLDTESSGSVLSASSDLVGNGALIRLPSGDPRLSVLGHRYPLPLSTSLNIFANGFE
jgi:hypothetical protein